MQPGDKYARQLSANVPSSSFCARTMKITFLLMHEWYYGYRDGFGWKAGRVVAGLIEEVSK